MMNESTCITALKRYLHHHLEMQMLYRGLGRLIESEKYSALFESLKATQKLASNARIRGLGSLSKTKELHIAIEKKIDRPDIPFEQHLSPSLCRALTSKKYIAAYDVVLTEEALQYKNDLGKFKQGEAHKFVGSVWSRLAGEVMFNKSDNILYDKDNGMFEPEKIKTLYACYAALNSEIEQYEHDDNRPYEFNRLRDKIRSFHLHEIGESAQKSSKDIQWPISTGLTSNEIASMDQDEFIRRMEGIYKRHHVGCKPFRGVGKEANAFRNWYKRVRSIIDKQKTINQVLAAWYAFEVGERAEKPIPLTKLFPVTKSNASIPNDSNASMFDFKEIKQATHKRLREKLKIIKEHFNSKNDATLREALWQLHDEPKFTKDKAKQNFEYFVTNF